MDGDGDNSPFNVALRKNMVLPDLEIGLMFRQVRDDVLAATGNMQEPHIYGTMGGEEVYLRTVAVAPSAASAAEASALVRQLQEERDWERRSEKIRPMPTRPLSPAGAAATENFWRMRPAKSSRST